MVWWMSGGGLKPCQGGLGLVSCYLLSLFLRFLFFIRNHFRLKSRLRKVFSIVWLMESNIKFDVLWKSNTIK